MRGRWYLVEGVWVSERLIRSARPRVPSPVVSALSQTSLCHATCTGCPHSSPTVAPSGQQSGTAPVSRMSGGTGEEMRCEMRHASSGVWVVMKIGRFPPPPFSNEPFVVSRSRQTREPTAPCLSYPSPYRTLRSLETLAPPVSTVLVRRSCALLVVWTRRRRDESGRECRAASMELPYEMYHPRNVLDLRPSLGTSGGSTVRMKGARRSQVANSADWFDASGSVTIRNSFLHVL